MRFRLVDAIAATAQVAVVAGAVALLVLNQGQLSVGLILLVCAANPLITATWIAARSRGATRFAQQTYRVEPLADTLAICRLDPAADVPVWAVGAVCAVVRTAEEFSIVCDAALVPEGVQASLPWRALKVIGPLDLDQVGVLAVLTIPLAVVGVAVFAVSTFDTDYLLVREANLFGALETLRRSGHQIEWEMKSGR